jgi:hypothetical protein
MQQRLTRRSKLLRADPDAEDKYSQFLTRKRSGGHQAKRRKEETNQKINTINKNACNTPRMYLK